MSKKCTTATKRFFFFLNRKTHSESDAISFVPCHDTRKGTLVEVINANVICCRGHKHPLYHEIKFGNRACLPRASGRLNRYGFFFFFLYKTDVQKEAVQYQVVFFNIRYIHPILYFTIAERQLIANEAAACFSINMYQ